MKNDADLTIARLAPLIRRKRISPVELTRFFLERISRLQPAINAYITVCPELALTQARRVEKELARGEYRGVLHGIPVSIKDIICTRGIRTTGGSKILGDFVPGANAAVVDRLLESGCVLLGKTNLHEFAYGATSVNPHFGPVRNPWDTRRISGGSSGGSAASVISAQALASLGTDTGGSIRIPSAACGCVGLKPTYGLIPLDGVIPLSGSLDHLGPLCRCVADAALLFETIRTPERRASFSGGMAARRLRDGVTSLRIGIPRQYFFDHVQPEVRRAVLAAATVFGKLGARIREVDMKGMKDTARLAADITAGEALAYHHDWLRRRPGDYGEDVRSRLEQSLGMTALNYILAMQERNAYSGGMQQALNSVDMLLAPTLPVVAPGIGQEEVRTGRTRTDVRLALLSLTRPANLSGLPAISVPCGFSPDGLPVGLQLIGRRFEEATLLRAAFAYEQATSWHRRFPEDPI